MLNLLKDILFKLGFIHGEQEKLDTRMVAVIDAIYHKPTAYQITILMQSKPTVNYIYDPVKQVYKIVVFEFDVKDIVETLQKLQERISPDGLIVDVKPIY